MRKLFIILSILIFVLCGCSAPEETKTLDYDAMDKEFGQYREDKKTEETATEGTEEESDNGDGPTQYNAESPQIKNCVEEYVRFALDDDPREYAKSFPESYTIAIMNTEGVTWDEAILLAQEKIAEKFEEKKKDYEVLSKTKGEFGFGVTIKSINRYSRETELIRAYSEYNISIVSAVEVKFIISVAEERKDGFIRLVKLSNGNWEPDMSYFEI